MNRKKIMSLLLAGSAAVSLHAATVDVKIVNATKGIYFTPLLVSAHPSTTSLYTLGSVSSANLKAMAEGGDISGLVSDLSAVNANITQNPASGVLAPGKSTTATLTTDSNNTNLTIVAMMLPTNDAFIGLNNVKIPTTPGTYTFNVNANDSGTEANDELLTNIPADPGSTMGTGGTGINVSSEGYVHIHRGIVGDFNTTGGQSDLDSATHRWLNPVALVTVTVH